MYVDSVVDAIVTIRENTEKQPSLLLSIKNRIKKLLINTVLILSTKFEIKKFFT